MLRRALSLLLPDGKEAAGHRENAINQTQQWLEQDRVTIYGGVVAWEDFRARIPLIVKKGSTVTLYQIQGKVWKKQETELGDDFIRNRKRWSYAREAAYKAWIFRKQFPGLDPDVKICFPNSRFRSTIPQLYEKVAFGKARREDVESLFVFVDASRAVEKVLQEVPDHLYLHPYIRGLSMDAQIGRISQLKGRRPDDIPFIITESCKSCSFRKKLPGSYGKGGCWEHHLDGDYRDPSSHVYDLIGQGNDRDSENGRYLQEQVPLPNEVDRFEKVYDEKRPIISIRDRRILQLLVSHGERVPVEWLKKGLRSCLESIRRPVHFIDFEAATCALPMDFGDRPYQPVLFQFSCHTIRKDGRIVHHHWLDTTLKGVHQKEFVKKLLSVPDIDQGTVFQYSPFEKQSLNRLFRTYHGQESYDKQVADGLQRVLNGSSAFGSGRFVDMSRLVRDFYYNSAMRNGLSLKEVLKSTISVSSFLKSAYNRPENLAGETVRLVRPDGAGEHPEDPYASIQQEMRRIDDGSSAMHAWLYTKTPFCGKSERESIQQVLKKYCSMDTLAMVMIFRHWKNLIDNKEQNRDITVWNKK